VLNFFPPGYENLYVSFYHYFEPGFVFPATVKTLQASRNYDFQPMMTIDNFDQDTLYEADNLRVTENGPNPYDYSINTPFTFQAGRWHHIEAEYILDTISPPNSNGIIRIWILGLAGPKKYNKN